CTHDQLTVIEGGRGRHRSRSNVSREGQALGSTRALELQMVIASGEPEIAQNRSSRCRASVGEIQRREGRSRRGQRLSAVEEDVSAAQQRERIRRAVHTNLEFIRGGVIGDLAICCWSGTRRYRHEVRGDGAGTGGRQ